MMPNEKVQIRASTRVIFSAILIVVLCLTGAFALRKHLIARGEAKKLDTSQVSHPHDKVREAVVRLQLPQIDQMAGDGKFDVILGDSIVEAAVLSNVDSRPLLNAGIGGGGIDTVFPILDLLNRYSGRINRAILAIGVNDASRDRISKSSEGRFAYLARWAQNYESAASRLADLGCQVELFLILPVEENKSLGTQYFDQAAIGKMNELIRELGKRRGWPVVEVPVPTIDGSREIMAPDSTADGVHPNAKTYRIFTDTIRSALQ